MIIHTNPRGEETKTVARSRQHSDQDRKFRGNAPRYLFIVLSTQVDTRDVMAASMFYFYSTNHISSNEG